ncbi:basic-leucine zipper domain-containing protein [Artemisia annua]|uniref:Basic-leucine zipper domain-containing protein n=1 Tax=Artemisia annua TaxID=35608 RepID=A0A2U1PXH6_ARTAN|nr:basic-leucine zipper domain-containing protein [Artemisia annua]
MEPMDDVWSKMSSLPSLHHPTTTTHDHFQDFFPPAATPGGGDTLHHPTPPPTTMLSFSTSGNSSRHDQEPPHTTGTTSSPVLAKQTSPVEYTEKFKRSMKNRESASRSRARKQARADELEQEVERLTKENAKLKRLHKEVVVACCRDLFYWRISFTFHVAVGFLIREGKGGSKKDRNKVTTGLKVVVYSSKSNEEPVSVNVEDTGSIAAKIQDIERQLLEGKLVLMGNDGEPLKSLKSDGQANTMEVFPCLSDSLSTPNTSTKVYIASPNDNASKKGDDGSVNVLKNAK